MWLLYIIFTVFCCFLTYRFTCYQLIKLDKINNKSFDAHQEYISKALDEISQIKTDVIQIKKDIYQ
ncbi:MAG: hypothetical protein HFJ43_04385 [Clostridia bacterium]|nr:hypothetical protein [Clostridia bacterium]